MEATEWLKPKEAAGYLGVSECTLYRIFKASKGKIKRYYVSPKKFTYSKVNLDAYKLSQVKEWTD